MQGTRDRLLASAAALFQSQGYNATGLNQILEASGAPKGVLYHHFPGGKQQLAAESVAFSGLGVGVGMNEALDAGTDALTALASLGEYLAVNLERSEFTQGCPVATVALEAASTNETIRGSCNDVYGAWLAAIRDRLAGWGVPETDRAQLAAFVLSSLQGALLLARVQRDPRVIRDTCHQLAELVTLKGHP